MVALQLPWQIEGRVGFAFLSSKGMLGYSFAVWAKWGCYWYCIVAYLEGNLLFVVEMAFC